MKVSGSETRVRSSLVAFRALPDEAEALQAKADELGLSVGDYLLACAGVRPVDVVRTVRLVAQAS